jgi:hypothetical protein
VRNRSVAAGRSRCRDGRFRRRRRRPRQGEVAGPGQQSAPNSRRSTLRPAGSAGIAGSPETLLAGVSCTSPASCLGAGAYGTSTSNTAVAEPWNGTTWRIQPVSPPVRALFTGLSDVSCTAPGACTAVGGYSTAQGHGKPLALFERWNGTTWRTQAPPALAGRAELSSVSCSAATACTAVGYALNGSAVQGVVHIYGV